MLLVIDCGLGKTYILQCSRNCGGKSNSYNQRRTLEQEEDFEDFFRRKLE
uniref:Uncharacterized protein n=1 Tax=Ciona savignyi TaxID=51511 RepID=H2YH86_CIOSA